MDNNNSASDDFSAAERYSAPHQPSFIERVAPALNGISAGVTSPVSAKEIRALLRARRLRANYFESELFADPAWDMLLEAYACHLDQQRISVSSLCYASGVPMTTGLRWLGKLEADGLIDREDDKFDSRRTWLRLTDVGLSALVRYFGDVQLTVTFSSNAQSGH